MWWWWRRLYSNSKSRGYDSWFLCSLTSLTISWPKVMALRISHIIEIKERNLVWVEADGKQIFKKSENLWKWNELLQIVSSPRWQEHLLCKNQHKQRYVSLTWSSSEMMDRHKSASTKEGNTPAACFLHCLQFHFLWPSSLFQLLYSLNWTLISASQNKNATRARNPFYWLQNNIYKLLISDVFIWYRL